MFLNTEEKQYNAQNQQRVGIIEKTAVGLGLGAASAVTFALPPDFSSLTTAVDFSTVGTAVLAIAALLAVPLVIRKGAKLVLAAIK